MKTKTLTNILSKKHFVAVKFQLKEGWNVDFR